MSKKFWDPETGEGHIFEDDETPPENYLPYHPNDSEKAGSAPKRKPKSDDGAGSKPDNDLSGGMSKAEIADALQAGGIEFNDKDKKEVLTQQLITALKNVLTSRGIAYEENEDAKTLLSKVGVQQE